MNNLSLHAAFITVWNLVTKKRGYKKNYFLEGFSCPKKFGTFRTLGTSVTPVTKFQNS
jgi:hypothetical protein